MSVDGCRVTSAVTDHVIGLGQSAAIKMATLSYASYSSALGSKNSLEIRSIFT